MAKTLIQTNSKAEREFGIETFIPEGSPLIGLSVSELEQKYNVRCDHIHNSPPQCETRRERPASGILTANMGIHVWGPSKAIKRLLDDINP